MAAENEGKTEDPTDKKKSESRKKGQVARSKELSTVVQLVTASIFFLLFGSYLAEGLFKSLAKALTLEREDAFDPSRMFIRLEQALDPIIVPLVTFALVMLVVGVLSSIVVGGFNFSMKAAAPKMSKLNPLTGLKRMFGAQGLVELVKSLAKFFVVAITAYVLIGVYFDELLHINIQNMPNNIEAALDILIWVFIWLALSLIIVAIIDVPYQIWKHNDSLKMTKQEVKDEHKNSEGDPIIKSKIRQLMFKASQRRMMAAVPEADVVVTNPTHYAVALKYDTDKGGAPFLVAKGVDEIAGHIRDIATAHDIPILCSPMLARSIYHTTELEDEIPEKLFTAVAQVLAYVFQLKQYKKGKARRPKEPSADKMPIPPDIQY